MTNKQDNKSPSAKNTSLKSCVLGRIDAENVCPRSRLFFHSRECFVWFFWFISVVVGAFAIAVMEFVVMHRQYALYEATHDNFFTFLIEVLPYLWIAVFILMAGVAVYNLRHTKHGYRKPVWFILASSVVLSFAGGSALHLLGFGHLIDHELGERVSLYSSQEKLEYRFWQAPEEGRMLGKQVLSTFSPTTTVIFEDHDGRRWQLLVTELDDIERQILIDQHKVRIMGIQTDREVPIFHACGVFLWSYQNNLSATDRLRERQAIISRLQRHAAFATAQGEGRSDALMLSADRTSPTECGNMAILARLELNLEAEATMSDR